MTEAIAIAFASLFVPFAAFAVVTLWVDFARWVRRKGWREPEERIEQIKEPNAQG